MARHWTTSCLLLCAGAFCALALDLSQVQVTTRKTISGVFMVTLNNQYSFNASVASEACKALHANIATQAQVEMALLNGLEMCRFGWVEEKIVVVPRIQASPKCGNNKIGLVTWRAAESKAFDAFCFNADTVTTLRASTASIPTTERPDRSTSPQHPATFPPFLITSTLAKRLPVTTPTFTRSSLSPSILPPFSSKAPEHPPKSTSSSQFTYKALHTTTVTTTTTTRLPSSSPPSIPSSSSSSSLSPPVHTGDLAPSHSNYPEKSNVGAPIAILTTAVLVLGILAGTAVYYKKKGRSLPFQRPAQEKGAAETEMFKHFRERDLKRRQSGGDGERSRKCSSDITLLMEQEAKAEIA
ncbi:lymphatic vessel endothelial hyaluronic receptor 1b isoform X2 [Clupea harengus]|uniref:Lymphatic vessel endothelial hyaluronic receptor 1b isoform X2 n=1 Tax=Clupea harengus TaxID=7950 RepID=A0A8M1KLH0_CLUHA|nr:lymphatic vessel endothelial hyaluronic receptor 1b isoform X2 [Clupea harengus]